MLLLGGAFGIIGFFFMGIGCCMCKLHDNMAAVYVKEQRARLPREHEKEKNECTEFRQQILYLNEEDDDHAVAIRPYFPDRTAKDWRRQD